MSLFKKKNPIEGDSIKVNWWDCYTYHGDWTSEWEKLKITQWEMETVGILLFIDKTRVIVSHMKSIDRGESKYITVIPMGTVKKITRLIEG